MMTVLLTDETVGKVEGEVEVGMVVVVTLADENGNPIEAEGTVAEILE